MQIAGVIAEYNPFHNGHRYQLAQIRQMAPKMPIVVAMSGNFLQRGEPACLDKWTRAKEAILNGADLVVEIPVAACMQPADRFAQGGIAVLKALGVSDLFFGAEHADYAFLDYANKVLTIKGDFKAKNKSYAQMFQEAVTQAVGHSVDQPNDLLGLSYAKQIVKLKAAINLHPIQRVGAAYHDEHIGNLAQIASATAVRTAVLSGNEDQIAAVVPAQTAHDIQAGPFLAWDDFWSYLQYNLINQPIDALGAIYGMAEGIEYRLKECVLKAEANSFEQWLKLVKNKRFTYTRLSRLACAILLHLTPDDVINYQKAPYARVLAFNQKGQEVLHAAKKTEDCRLLAKISQDDRKKFFLPDYRAGKIYQLQNGHEQDVKRAPLRF